MRSLNTKHHRKPRSAGGAESPENIIVVTEREHRAWHLLFANMGPQAITRAINKKWLDPDWWLVACKKKNRRKKVGR